MNRVEEWCGYTPCWVARKVQDEQFSPEGRLMMEQVATSSSSKAEWVGAKNLPGDMALRCYYTYRLQKALKATKKTAHQNL